MLGLTIKDVHPLIRDYIDENANVETRISIVKNKTIRPPALYACVTHTYESLGQVISCIEGPKGDQNESICADLTKKFWDVWRDSNVSEFIQGG